MATEVLTRTLCDVCNRDAIKREGTRYTFRVGGKAYEFDACEEHSAPITDCVKILEEYGRTPSGLTAAPAKQERRIGCPLCEGNFSHPSSLASHVRRSHGMSVARAKGQPEPFKCSVCSMPFARPQALTLHLAAHQRRGEVPPEDKPRRRTTRVAAPSAQA